MPPLPRPPSPATVTLPPREAPVAAETDVLVVGGGPAGLGAALAASEAGARVVLVERYGFLGGNATAALVMPWASGHASNPSAVRSGSITLMPTDQGEAEPVIRGLNQEIIDRLVLAGGAIPPSQATGYAVSIDPEILKQVALDMLDDRDVSFVLHSFASGVVGDGRIEGVVLETKSGPLVVRADVVVDCTGDGDVAAAAGAQFEMGRPEDGLTQPMTLMSLYADFDFSAFERYVTEHPDQWTGVSGLWDLIREAEAAGEFKMPREDMLFFATPHWQEVSANATRVTRVFGTDVFDLTRAEWESRRQLRAVTEFLLRHVPGFRRAFVAQSGAQIGVRETRRVVGQYVLTGEDVLSARKFDDVVARNAYPVDIHNPTGGGTLLRRVPPNDAYDIPLRCLVPAETNSLLVAGRCISTTHEAHSSVRVMPCSVATGQAAGTCAALAARSRRQPRDVPAAEVQHELVKQGADLGGKTG